MAPDPGRGGHRGPAGARRRAAGGAGLESAILAGVLLFLLGGFWDVAWHIEVGRDTFWSPPTSCSTPGC